METLKPLKTAVTPALRVFLGAVLVYAGVAKLFDHASFVGQLQSMGFGEGSIVFAVSLYLPFLEICCGIALVLRRATFGASLLSFLLLVSFEGGLAYAWLTGYRGECACFGRFWGGSTVPTAFLRNLFLIAIAGVVFAREKALALEGIALSTPGPIGNEETFHGSDSTFHGSDGALPSRGSITSLFLVLAFFGIATSTFASVSVQPSELIVDAMLKQPVVLSLEVVSDRPLDHVDLKADGLRIQREIHRQDPNRVRFLIEPDTYSPASISGQINVVDARGAVLCAARVRGEVKPYVKVSPGRLFLGSLEYGTKTGAMIEKRFRVAAGGDWKVLDVDASDFPGAKIKILDQVDGSKDLILRFSEDALKEGQPFGAFLKKSIRVRTDVAQQAKIEIPVTAMLSRNGTKRNFSTYLFKGNERWQGRWGTPNVAAAVIGPLALLAFGYGVLLLGRRSTTSQPVRPPRILPAGSDNRSFRSYWPHRLQASAPACAGMLLVLAAIAGMVLLGRTYSRGGWVAFAVGLLCMLLLMNGYRRLLGMGAAMFLGILALQPAGLQRVNSTVSLSDDASIRNRLLVWRGAVEMIADQPRGVGRDNFGKVFSDYYQEPWHRSAYSTAINDYLTVAAERGLGWMVACFFAGSLLILAAILDARRQNHSWVIPVVGLAAAMAVSSLFSSLVFVRDVKVLWVVAVAVMLTYCCWQLIAAWRARVLTRRESGSHSPGLDPAVVARRSRRISLPARAVIAAAFVAMAVTGIVLFTASQRPVRHASASWQHGKFGGKRLDYLPCRSPAQGTIVYLPSEAAPLSVDGRKVLRPFAHEGWGAITSELPPYDQDAAVVLAQIVRSLAKPVIILAEKDKARLGVTVAASLHSDDQPDLVVIDPVFASALGECDQANSGFAVSEAKTIEMADWKEFQKDPQKGARKLSARFQTLINSIQSERQVARR